MFSTHRFAEDWASGGWHIYIIHVTFQTIFTANKKVIKYTTKNPKQFNTYVIVETMA